MIINIVKRKQEQKAIDWTYVNSELKNLNFSIIQSKPISLFDVDTVWKDNPSNYGGDSPVIASSLGALNAAFIHRGYTRKELYQLIAAPGVGKSTLLVNESCGAVLQGNRVIHAVLGDLTSYDIWIKIVSRLFGNPQFSSSELIKYPKEWILEQMKMIPDDRFQRIAILAYPSGTVTVEQFREDVIRTKNELLGGRVDLITADYADNFKTDATNLYQKGGDLYGGLHKLSWTENAVILTASQPKTGLWEKEFLTDQNAAAESGQKQHILGMSMNLGKPTRLQDGTSICVGYTTKLRRGFPNRYYYYRINYANCMVDELTFDQYQQLKTESVVATANASSGGFTV